MKVEFDRDKDAVNRLKHGVSLADAERMDFDSALYVRDDRYGVYLPTRRAAGDLVTKSQ